MARMTHQEAAATSNTTVNHTNWIYAAHAAAAREIREDKQI
jgi:hypothetical protein